MARDSDSIEGARAPDIEEAWAVEAERRWLEIASGEVETIPWEGCERSSTAGDDTDEVTSRYRKSLRPRSGRRSRLDDSRHIEGDSSSRFTAPPTLPPMRFRRFGMTG